MRYLMLDVWGRVLDLRDVVDEWIFDEKHGLHAVAACRIAVGLTVLGLLTTNFADRQLWVGPAAIWAEPVRAISNFPEINLLASASAGFVTVFYVVAMLFALAFVVGWHAKLANIGTLFTWIAVVGQNPIVGGQSDNLIRLTLLWLLLIHTTEHWSLDALRRQKPLRDDVDSGHVKQALNHRDDALPKWVPTSLHNIGFAGLLVQTVLFYMAAGLSKASESVWQHGTALYYTMQLPEYRPFPWASDFLSHSHVLVSLATYAVLLTQLFFGPLLLNRTARNIVVVLAIAVNVFFGVFMALVWSSLAVIAVTFLFLSDHTWERVEGNVGDWLTTAGFWIANRRDGALDRLDDLRKKRSRKEITNGSAETDTDVVQEISKD